MKNLLFLTLFLQLLLFSCNTDPEDDKAPVPEITDDEDTEVTTEEKYFTNPLKRGADPWVLQKDENYYFTYTQGSKIVLQSTKKMSAISEAMALTVWTPPPNTAYSKNIWAPELHALDGKWYIYFAADDGSNDNHRMHVIESTSRLPTTPTWEYKGKVADPSDKWAIDGSVFEYEDQLYFIWSGWEGDVNGSQEIYVAKMANPWTIEGDRVQIARPEYDWEKHDMPINEGPQPLMGPDGQLFIVYSGSGFWTDEYALGLLTLKEGGDVLNPLDWQKSPAPVFSKKAEHGAYAPGHNGFFKTIDGKEDWIIYHARTYPGGGSTNYRNIRMQKFTWNEDGTPNFGEPVKVGKEILKPSGE